MQTICHFISVLWFERSLTGPNQPLASSLPTYKQLHINLMLQPHAVNPLTLVLNKIWRSSLNPLQAVWWIISLPLSLKWKGLIVSSFTLAVICKKKCFISFLEQNHRRQFTFASESSPWLEIEKDSTVLKWRREASMILRSRALSKCPWANN